jgi:ferredoxin
MPRRILAALAFYLALAILPAQDRFPRPDFRSGYTEPEISQPAPRGWVWQAVDIAVLLVCLTASALALYRFRSRLLLACVAALSTAYFGFMRRGCLCPVGSVQNLAAALLGGGQGAGIHAALLFILPLAASLLLGRVYCGGVCPFGAVQDFLLVKPLRPPRALDQTLSLVPGLFLGLAVLGAATGTGFLICRLDPFVGLFRFSFTSIGLAMSVVVGILSVFIARPYCRWLCPYGALHALAARLSLRHIQVSPADCVECRLCETSCPQDAIRPPGKEPRSGERAEARRRMERHIAFLALYVAGGVALGLMARSLLRALHPAIALERALASESSLERGSSLATATFLASGKSIEAMAEEAAAARRHIDIGMLLYGAFAGLLAWAAIAKAMKHKRKPGYDVDPWRCVSCGRCLSTCPVGRRGRGGP